MSKRAIVYIVIGAAAAVPVGWIAGELLEDFGPDNFGTATLVVAVGSWVIGWLCGHRMGNKKRNTTE